MRELGWVHGQNFIVQRRAYGGHVERIPDLVTELLQWGMDLLVVTGQTDARRVIQVTRTIPLIATAAGDLVQAGLAASLARPGGNVTGVQTLEPEVSGKQVAILKEAMPGLTRLGVLAVDPEANEAAMRSQPSVRAAETSGKVIGVRLQVVAIRRVEALGAAFSAFRAGRAQGLLVLRTAFADMGPHRRAITEYALRHRVPTISALLSFARDGGLLSYGYDGREISRLLADTIDQVLREVPVGEVPIRQATTFQLTINLTTAKGVGLTIPPSLLQRADQVIE